MSEFTTKPPGHAIVASCTFVELDVEDLWCEIVDDADCQIPEAVMEGLRLRSDVICEAMIQRGQEVMEDLLRGMAESGAPNALAVDAASVTSEP